MSRRNNIITGETGIFSDRCLCGRQKRPRTSFCYICYRVLPDHLRNDLYKRFDAGYPQAFTAAKRFLERVGILISAAS